MPKRTKPTTDRQGHHLFLDKPERGAVANPNRGNDRSLVQNYKGHISPCEEVKSRDTVAIRKQNALDQCAGYPMVFGMPRDRVMASSTNAEHTRSVSRRPEIRAETERYALAARQPQPKESDFRTSDPNRQVIDRRTGRPLIESVLCDYGSTELPKRTTGTKVFPASYRNSEVDASDIPRAARHEMESMPSSYKTNLVRTLCMLYPKFTAETRIARQQEAHRTNGRFKGQGLAHSPSRAGIAEEAGKRATREVCSRPNNVRLVALMRGAAPTAP